VRLRRVGRPESSVRNHSELLPALQIVDGFPRSSLEIHSKSGVGANSCRYLGGTLDTED
jgi:hypothetical protein